MATTSAESSEATHAFVPGDMVVVAEGELQHLQGKIVRVDGNKITMLPKHEDLKDPLEFQAVELKKCVTYLLVHTCYIHMCLLS